MIFMTIGLVAGVIAGWKLEGKKEGFLDYSISVVMAFILGLMGAVIGLIIAIGIGALLPSEYILNNQVELVALKDNSSISGSFFLGCGSIESEFYYVFYKKEKDGSITFSKLLANSHVKIYEEERKDGLIEVFEKDFIKKTSYLFGVVAGSPKYKIHIPKGSILRNFELDLR